LEEELGRCLTLGFHWLLAMVNWAITGKRQITLEAAKGRGDRSMSRDAGPFYGRSGT